MTRIAVVVPTLRQAGAERVAAVLAAEFARRADVVVVTCDPRISARELARRQQAPWAGAVPPGCAHVHLPATGIGPLRLAVLAVRLGRLLRRRQVDVAYSFLTYTNILVALARPLAGRRLVHVASEHAMAGSLRTDGWKLRLLARVLPLVYRWPDRLVAVSDAARSSLVAAGAIRRPERAVTVPNPVDVDEVRRRAGEPCPVAERAARLRQDGPVLACFARLHPDKSHRTLLDAMALLPASYRLLLAGEGPERRALQRHRDALGLADRVEFVGHLANPYPLMRTVDAVVLPSVAEGFGLVALEAAALGVPFVGSDCGGLAEVAARLGQPTFPTGDSAGLAARLAALPDPTGRSADGVPAAFLPAGVAAEYLRLGARRVERQPMA